MTPGLQEQISRLEACYGPLDPPAVTDPFEMILSAPTSSCGVMARRSATGAFPSAKPVH